jgi:hypothetical protein
MKKFLRERLKITKNKKILRRATTLGHSRANKTTKELKRKKHLRELKIRMKKLKTAI